MNEIFEDDILSGGHTIESFALDSVRVPLQSDPVKLGHYRSYKGFRNELAPK